MTENSNTIIDELISSGVVPDIEIALPTRGYFYEKGKVVSDSVNLNELKIMPISILEESSFMDPIMLATGEAVIKMIKRVCPGITDPENLCDLDVQALIIAARMASRGNIYEVVHECSKCNKKNENKIDLNHHINNFSTYTDDEFNFFKLEIKKNINQVVCLRPILYKDAIKTQIQLINNENNKIEEEINEKEMLNPEFIERYKDKFNSFIGANYDSVVDSIYYIESEKLGKFADREIINKWFNLLPHDVAKEIIDRINEIHNDIRDRSKFKYNCVHCNEENIFYLELDIQKLFIMAEDTKPVKNSSAESKNTEIIKKTSTKKSQRLS